MSVSIAAIAAKTKRDKAALRKKKEPAPIEPGEDEIPAATLTFESPEAYLETMRNVSKLTDAVGKARKRMETSFGEGFMVNTDGSARIRATLTISKDPKAKSGLVEFIVTRGEAKKPVEEALPEKTVKKVSAATAANQIFQGAPVRTALAESMGVQVLENTAAVLCAEANERNGDDANKPHPYPKSIASDADKRHAKMHLVAQVLGLVWQNTKDELERTAPAGKVQKKAFVDKGLTSLAAKLLDDPNAIMDVPAVRDVYKKVTGVDPAEKVFGGCICCGAKGCASCKVVMVNKVDPQVLGKEVAEDKGEEAVLQCDGGEEEKGMAAEKEEEEEDEEEKPQTDDEAAMADSDEADAAAQFADSPYSLKRRADGACEAEPSSKKMVARV